MDYNKSIAIIGNRSGHKGHTFTPLLEFTNSHKLKRRHEEGGWLNFHKTYYSSTDEVRMLCRQFSSSFLDVLALLLRLDFDGQIQLLYRLS